MSILAAQMQFRSRISRNLPGDTLPRLSLAVSLNFGWDDFGFESVLKITDAEIITAAVPEPSGLALLCIGLPGLAKIRKKHTGRMPQSRQSA
ncbi:MAG: PEP-CTERM sorting domain-containing protein [Gammaproteobacteria bacterium]|nr:PEP-CTERM sorting domain-containing protein [Gammaproteobacteria bacterium]